VRPSDIVRHIPKPRFAVGDRVRDNPLHGPQTIVAFLSDGRAVLEYDAGETTNVIARDVSCLERAK
jgi:hypothetical protein